MLKKANQVNDMQIVVLPSVPSSLKFSLLSEIIAHQVRQFRTNHLFNGFFLLSYRQAGRNKLKHKLPQYAMHWSCVLVYREIGVYWDLVYKDKQQYTENIQV